MKKLSIKSDCKTFYLQILCVTVFLLAQSCSLTSSKIILSRDKSNSVDSLAFIDQKKTPKVQNSSLRRTQDTSIKSIFIDAINLKVRGNYRQSNELLQLLYNRSLDWSIRSALADNFIQLRKLDEAEIYAREAYILSEKNIETIAPLAEILVSKKKYQEALYHYLCLDSIAPGRVNKRTISQLFEIISPDSCIQWYERELVTKHDPFIANRLLQIYINTEKKQEIKRILPKIREYYSDESELDDIIIESYIEIEEYDSAYSFFWNKLPTKYGDDIFTLFSPLGKGLYDRSDSVNIAKEIAQRLVHKIDSLHWSSWKIPFWSGILAAEVDEDSIAYKLFDKALSQGTSGFLSSQSDFNPEPGIQIMIFYLRQQDASKVIESGNRLLRIFPEHARISFFLALGYSRLGIQDSSIAVLEGIIQRDNEDVEALNQLAIEYTIIGKRQKADSIYYQALRIQPDNSLSSNNLAYSIAEYSHNQDTLIFALKLAKQALRSDPENASYLDTHGFILSKLGNIKESLSYFIESLRINDESSSVWEHLGDTYTLLGDKFKACEAFTKALHILERRDESYIEKLTTLRNKIQKCK